MNIWLKLIIWVYCLQIGSTIQAQCPDQQAVYDHLEKISLLTDAALRIRELHQLEHQCIRCRQTTDSIFAKVLHVLGRSYWESGDLVRGETYTKKAIAINSIRSVKTRQANLPNSFNNLGQILAEQNKYKQAFKAFDQSVQISRLYPLRYKVGATTLAKYANLLLLLGDYDKAVERGQQGYELAKRAGEPRLVVQNLVELSQALVKLNQYDKAREAIAMALPIVKRLSDPTELSNTLSVTGMIHEETDQPDEAVLYYKKAFLVSKQAGNRYGCAQTLSSLAHFYQTKQIDNSKALSYLQQAIPYTDDKNDRALLLGDIGAVYRQEKEYQKGLTYYQRALLTFSIEFNDSLCTSNPKAETIRIIRQKGYLLTLIQDKADTWLAYAHATANNPQRLKYALETYKVADQMIDFMRWEHTGQLSKLFWREKTRGMYERAIETCLQLKNADQALRFFEKSRAAMLSDKLNELGARQKLSPQQIKEEQRLQQQANGQQANLDTIANRTGTAYRTAQSALDNAQANLDKFRKQLETSNPAYYWYKYDTTVTSLAELRRHLTKQKASFVTYFVGDTTLYVLGVTADTSVLYSQPLRSYQQNVQTFLGLLASPDAMNYKPKRDQFLALGNGLYRQLIAPLNLPAGRVIVSPDGSFVPFETLSRKSAEADYLVDNYAFSYTYSARLLLKEWGGNRAKTSRHEFLGIAPVDFAPSLKQVTLSRSDESLKRIAGYFHPSELLTHKDATRRAFLKEAADASIIQLFTHATADSSGEEPRLYFADSTLKLSDLNDGAMPNAQLVVLAACKTGIGAVQQGEGVFSLARGFASLGVPSVLTTLWSVQNLATYDLTELFYKYIDEGLPKDIALQQAKKDWLKQADQANQSPNIWAGLIVVGDTEPLERTKYGLWGTVSLLLTLAGLAGWFWRKRKRRPMSSVSLPHSV